MSFKGRSTIPPRWDPKTVPPRSVIADALLCPFPQSLNLHVRQAHEHSGKWLRKIYGDAPLVRKAQEARMAWMVAGFYPTTGLDQLCVASDYLCWAFTLDDLGDETAIGQRPAQLSQLFQDFDDVFHGRAVARSEDPALVALRDILDRLARFATPADLKTFWTANRAYFGGMLWEANNRAGNWVPNESSFMMMRPAAGAVPPFFALIEPLENIRLPREVREDPQVQELERLAGGIVCWINDVLSYEKERKLNDVHNLAIVYETHRDLPPGEALTQAVALSNAEVDGFMAREASLPSFGEANDRELRRYLDTLHSMIRITRDWTLGSARYAEPETSTAAAAG